ncbi:diguanylate cyclase (GGDEF) domain-containing protein [Streptomyces zhaozhouensis]|uniref:Diguanylate cyclase (GGDEF) domain-containing protein n=1 Tax=Streptomyces zhaozhouensis TaxID=1300267 RepID=A0A286DTT6_9ACTN|nr:GGDEF domain-containing protein [Streptomyces zhaozhouensis]SOD62068.1 diguanylate cyclase (GGDEF) domain-containing protein [Streptomyces zhaozhouensis]
MAEERLWAVVDVARGMAAERGLAQAARAGADRARRALGGAHAAISVWERASGAAAPPRLRVLAAAGEPSAGRPEPADRSEPALVAPILVHGGEWGELRVVRGREQPAFTPEEQSFAPALAAVLAAGFAQYERLREIRRLAFTDALTGLANRRAVDHALAEALRGHRERGAVLTLVVCDVNGLKRVNDTHGHAVGDRLLIRFAEVLSRAAAPLPGALAARLGGDEFCLLAVETDPAEVERAAAEVCRGAAALELSEGVACGVASTEVVPGRLRSGRRLFRLADAAQYRAKAARSPAPVVAGRGDWERVAALPAVPAGGERRAFRGRERPPAAGSG